MLKMSLIDLYFQNVFSAALDWAAMVGPFDDTLARSYFYKLISGLNACHAANVVHRDMKPDNLLLNEAFDIKLADFGMAAAIAVDGAMRTTRCGTDSFMSPELLSLPHGQAYDPKPVDVFACGCILFIFLVGGAGRDRLVPRIFFEL
jgi:serine/threonine protein kinase